MKLLWLDLETTGLDPRKDMILEFALLITELSDPFDSDGLAAAFALHAPLRTFFRDEDLDPVVLAMHTKNGLLADCRSREPRMRQEEAEDRILAFTGGAYAARDEKFVLAGSSVHFDHEFLKVHMPRFASLLSHRHYDVSAIKLFCQSLGMPKFPKAEAHRALADVHESIAHAKACKEWLGR